jgi:hypothetical protein
LIDPSRVMNENAEAGKSYKDSSANGRTNDK